jgi:hypothetical protein
VPGAAVAAADAAAAAEEALEAALSTSEDEPHAVVIATAASDAPNPAFRHPFRMYVLRSAPATARPGSGRPITDSDPPTAMTCDSPTVGADGRGPRPGGCDRCGGWGGADAGVTPATAGRDGHPGDHREGRGSLAFGAP